MEGITYGIKVSKDVTDNLTSVYVGARGLLEILNDRIIPVHIPLEQIRTLQPDNPDPYHNHHAAHLNAGFLYAALDLHASRQVEALPSCYVELPPAGLASVGRSVLCELVKAELYLSYPEV